LQRSVSALGARVHGVWLRPPHPRRRESNSRSPQAPRRLSSDAPPVLVGRRFVKIGEFHEVEQGARCFSPGWEQPVDNRPRWRRRTQLRLRPSPEETRLSKECSATEGRPAHRWKAPRVRRLSCLFAEVGRTRPSPRQPRASEEVEDRVARSHGSLRRVGWQRARGETVTKTPPPPEASSSVEFSEARKAQEEPPIDAATVS